MRALEALQKGAFEPETISLLTKALEAAWEKVRDQTSDKELVRLRLASSILDLAEAGFRDEILLAQYAVDAVMPALRIQVFHPPSASYEQAAAI